MRLNGLAAALLAMSSLPAIAHELSTAELENRRLALEFMDALHAKDVTRAASYISDGYIQHNPRIPTGKSGFISFLTPLWAGAKPGKPEVPVETITQGDLVTLIYRKPKPEPADPSKTYDSFWFDTFRVKDGKIVEHWDPATKPAAPAK